MPLTLRNSILTAWPAALVIASLAGGLSAAPARPAPAPRPALARELAPVLRSPAATISRQRAVTRYWTAARMRGARRDARTLRGAGTLRGAWSDGDTLGGGLRWVHGGAVTRTVGKVFFTMNGMDYVCSGTAVDSARQDVVLTAAHCTDNGSGAWAANWMFVPGYTDGAEPYGTYPARRFYVSRQWEKLQHRSSARSEAYDVAFVTVNPAASASRAYSGPAYRGTVYRGTVYRGTVYRGTARAGGRLGQVAGGQPVSFAGSGSAFEEARRRDTYVFGYPSDPPFTGLYPNFCAGYPWHARNDAVALPCTMTAGDSGGPWVTGFNPRTGTGTIIGITTYKFGNGESMLYGTVLGPGAKALYRAAARG